MRRLIFPFKYNLFAFACFIPRRLMLKALLMLACFVLINSTVAEASSDFTPTELSQLGSHNSRLTLFQQAVADDLVGKNNDARKAYDALKGTDLSAQIAVPSAVNRIALGQFDEAKQAFDTLSTSQNDRERDYAHLWQLWLAARMNPNTLKKKLDLLTSVMNASSPYQQALIRLYAGTGSADEVFATLAVMPGTDELQRRDALTVATFFIGGYLQYVARDNKAALELYKREHNHLNNTSLETPLVNKAAATLQAMKN
jgi:hypothetical protein